MLLLPNLLDDLIRTSIAEQWLKDLADVARLAATSRRMRGLLRAGVERALALQRELFLDLAKNKKIKKAYIWWDG